MEDVPNTEAVQTSDNTETVDDKPLLSPDTVTDGATDAETGEDSKPEGDTQPAATEGADDQPLLTPGVDENGKSELAGAPESYGDFELPEGFAFDDEMKAQVDSLFKELDLSQKGAQKLVDAYTERMIAQKEAELADLADRRKQWRADVRKSPTYAKDKAFAIKGINAVVTTPEERALFKDSWMSDHPALFSMFVKVGRLVGEDTPLPRGGSDVGGGSAVERFPIKL